MAQTLTAIYFHIVFSTKNRANLIDPEIESDLYSYMAGIIKNRNSRLIIGNGTQNHSHLLVSLDKNERLPDLVGSVKRNTTNWIRSQGGMNSKFQWQDGYSAFSVGYTHLDDVRNYIAGQKEHHVKRLFEDEMRGFYGKYNVAFDEEYVWD
jgi:putative transposase